MKAFAAMLQNQHVGPIVDRRNRSAETRLFRAKAIITTALGHTISFTPWSVLTLLASDRVDWQRPGGLWGQSLAGRRRYGRRRYGRRRAFGRACFAGPDARRCWRRYKA